MRSVWMGMGWRWTRTAALLLSAALALTAGCADPPPGGVGGDDDNNGGLNNDSNSGGGPNSDANNNADDGANSDDPDGAGNNGDGDDNNGANNGDGNNANNGDANNGTAQTCTAEPTEACDGLDNNCDGQVDEGCTCTVAEQACYSARPGTINVGLCRQGVQRCEGEFYGDCEGQITPADETCDGADNDCDGQIDEGFDVGQRCGGGEGQCTSQGTLGCTADGRGVECNAVEVEPGAERCDNLDNDCDGQVDEDFGDLGDPCTVGLGACQNSGRTVCTADGAATTCGAQPLAPSDERCDGIDNNCNGSIDEAWPGLNSACTNGQGICAAEGTLRCSADGRDAVCDATPRSPGAESCDGLDNDCDGEVDELAECSNHAPAVQCPGEITASTLETITATASATDPDGDAVTVSWTLTSAPTGTSSSPNPNNRNATNLFLDLAGVFVLRFTATDPHGASSSCDVRVNSVPSEQFRVELIWNVGATNDRSDVDLHLLRVTGSARWFTSADCYFANCDSSSGDVLNWGAAGTADNPRLDLDDVEGNGPENINIDQVENATYRVGVHYWDADGFGDSTVILRIYCNGTVAREFEPVTLSAVGVNASGNDFWLAADVVWSGPICQVQELGTPGNRDIRTRGSL